MAHVDYFFSTLSPWTYLAGTRLEEIAGRHGATVSYKPLDIVALFGRTGGTPPAQRHPSRQAYRAQDLQRQSAALGMPFNLKPAHWPTNGAPAAYAIIAAQTAAGEGGDGDLGALCHAVTRAVWAEDRDIAEDAVVQDLLAGAGFDPGLADRGLFTAAGIYEQNLEEAVTRGCFGAPFYIVSDTDERFWGQDRLADLDRHLGTL